MHEHELVPFNSLVIEKSFIEPGVPIQDIYTLEDSPEVIIRAGLDNAYAEGHYGDYNYHEHLDNRDILNRLRDHYGLAIPNFHIVIGGNNRFYMVTQRIHGVNLHLKKFRKSEKDEAEAKLAKFYSTLTDVLIDTSNTGGKMIGDLTRAGADQSGNRQWVYGKRKGDSENQVWLVDLGPVVEEFMPHDGFFFGNQFPWLFDMVLETEKKLGCKFTNAREKLVGYMEAEAIINPDVRNRYIERFLRHQKMFGNI